MDGKGTAAVTDARQITASLRRVHATMSSSVMNADEAVSVLLQDGAILEDTLQDHKYGLKGSLQTTKHRLSRIKSAETREAYMIFISLSFFTSVVIYIISKRTRLLTIAWLAMHGAIRGKNAITSMTSKAGKVEFNASAVISTNLSESLMTTLTQEIPPLVSSSKLLSIPETLNIEHIEELNDLSAALSNVIDNVLSNGMTELSAEDIKADLEILAAASSESELSDVVIPVTTTEVSDVAPTISDVIVKESVSLAPVSTSSSSSSESLSVSVEVTVSGENIQITGESQVENLIKDSNGQSRTLEGYFSGGVSVKDVKVDFELPGPAASESESKLRDDALPRLIEDVSDMTPTISDVIVKESVSLAPVSTSSSSSSLSVSVEVSAGGEKIEVIYGEGQVRRFSGEILDRDSDAGTKTELDASSQSEDQRISVEQAQIAEQDQQIKESNTDATDLDKLDSVEEIQYVGPTRSYMFDEYRDENIPEIDDVINDYSDDDEESSDGVVQMGNPVNDGDKLQPITVIDSIKQEDVVDVILNGENNSRDEL